MSDQPLSPISTLSGSGAAASEPEFLAVGRVLRPHGVHGELRVEVHTDDPERFGVYPQVYLGDSLTRYRIKKYRLVQGAVLLFLHGIHTRDQAEQLRDQWIWIARADAMPLAEGEYYTYQVLGMRVVSDEGLELGQVTEILETGANDVYVVRGLRGEILLPVIAQVIVNVDLQTRQMTVHLLDGLLE